MVDTSILIDYFRKTDKANSVWITLVDRGFDFAISAVTKYEIYSRANKSQTLFWNKVLTAITVIPFDSNCVIVAVEINATLKRKRQQIDLADLFIAACAITKKIPIATLNTKHFNRINTLELIK